jgi:hypothetical protein
MHKAVETSDESLWSFTARSLSTKYFSEVERRLDG